MKLQVPGGHIRGKCRGREAIFEENAERETHTEEDRKKRKRESGWKETERVWRKQEKEREERGREVENE